MKLYGGCRHLTNPNRNFVIRPNSLQKALHVCEVLLSAINLHITSVALFALSMMGLQGDLHVCAFVCRAKLEEALERMDRVVLAMEGDSVHASTYISDMVVQLTDNIAAESVSPALQQASIPC